MHLQSVRAILDGGWADDGSVRNTAETRKGGTLVDGHGGAVLPRTKPWASAELLANPAIEETVEALLGPGCLLTSLSGNTCLPGCGFQRLHVDSIWRHRSAAEAQQAGQPWPLKTTSVVVNFSGSDQSPANGSTVSLSHAPAAPTPPQQRRHSGQAGHGFIVQVDVV